MMYFNVVDLSVQMTVRTSIIMPDICFCIKKFPDIKKLNILPNLFFLYKFYKSFVFFNKTLGAIWSNFPDS